MTDGTQQGGAGRIAGRRAFLRGAAGAGLAVAALAVSAEQAEAHRALGPTDQAGAAVPPWPDDALGQLAVVWRVGTTRPAVALTFDDGPDPRWTPAILGLLESAGARATFFCVGRAAARHPSLVRRAAALGEVANHSWSHPDLAIVDPARVGDEIRRTHDTLAGIVGEPPRLFRPPYGNLRGRVLIAAARHGYRLVLWSDMVQRAHHSAAADAARLARDARPGQILLAHDGRGNRAGTLERLPALLRGLGAAGLRATTVSDLLAGA